MTDTIDEVVHPDWQVCLARGLLQWDQRSSLRVAIKVGDGDVFTVIIRADGRVILFSRRPGWGGDEVFGGTYDELAAFIEEHKDDPQMWEARGG